MATRITFFIVLGFLFCTCDKEQTVDTPLRLLQAFIGTTEIDLSGTVITVGLPVDRTITLVFSSPFDQTTAIDAIQLKTDQQVVGSTLTFLADGRTVVVYPVGLLQNNTVYTLAISAALTGSGGRPFTPVDVTFKTILPNLTVESMTIDGKDAGPGNLITNVSRDLSMALHFSAPVNTDMLEAAAGLDGPGESGLEFSYEDGNRTVYISSGASLQHLMRYEFVISGTLEGALGEPFGGIAKTLYTSVDDTPKFPVVSDDELLTLVQQQTFRYFYDFAHPASGMARERNTSGNTVTGGGSGFGIMALIVGMERGFITRDEGLARMDKILTFLESADRFHGAWPHWMNGYSGDVIPFSANDNGSDLVETSFLMQGLLTFRQYLNPDIPAEKTSVDRINALWHSVEWDWYTREGQEVLYWHWSPDKQWTMNHHIRGYDEALITYFLAAASPTHSIEASVYHQGWAQNGAIVNKRNYFNITLPLGPDYGGPLFFSHYSFLGLDPQGLRDQYANYWDQNARHTSINHAYCVANPKAYVAYGDACWGLTASDNQDGYAAHSPTNDLGVITPSAALASFPYTPEQSMKALKFFYYTLGDRLWGPYGFYDAFNITAGWTADSYLAIDQGPIIVMIENYRTGLLWNLFMSAPEVSVAMDRLGFTR